ncbi:hypothetical protein OEZ85_006808 [Tetradesmus obliquus]|uniref:FAD-binding PCMH-type domain-containing protein n=1 Tax=Tetradesmus obliquus TaxID=3088 RepID=A0ABY8TZT6_TETOB|nr:hypothetical protein OEZ85_006808 [Tetradesmus obliquus]
MVAVAAANNQAQTCNTPNGLATAPKALYVDVPQEQEAPDAPAHQPRLLCAAANSSQEWSCSNWAGTVSWAPSSVVVPASEDGLAAFLKASAASAAASGKPRPPMKVVGFAHSWAGLYTPANASDGTPGITLALHKLSGITKVTDTHVEVLAGTSFAQLFQELAALNLTLAWPPGGIQGLTVGGAVSVGFHGSQMSVGGVSSVVQSLRLLDTSGNTHELNDSSNADAMRAARMALGMCGIITRVQLPVTSEFHLRRRRWRVDDSDAFLDYQLPQLKQQYDRFHWYLHPETATSWPMYWEPATAAESAAEGRSCRTAAEQWEDAQEKEFGVDGLPLIMRWDNCSDISSRSLTHAIDMEQQPLWNGEYYVALDDAGEAAATRAILEGFQAVAESRGLSKPSTHLWLHVRYVGGDTSSLLNPCYGSATCAAFELGLVAPAMDAELPPWDEWAAYFGAMEKVLRGYNGRPHHAKYYTAEVPSQPGFGLPVEQFRRECARFDPQRLLRNERFDAVFLAGTGAQQA